MQRPIFVAATKQHVGKTTTCLALVSGLKKRYGKVGFLKPVGQQHVPIEVAGGGGGVEGGASVEGETIRVDKDVALVREHFGLDHLDYRDMSPVIVPRGYTKRYVDGEISNDDQIDAVERAMAGIESTSDVVLVEGTGHCAVGSIVGLNNARAAKILGADMVLVANGGIGRAFDELELNRQICESEGVRVAGVVVNKVRPDKYEQTREYVSKAMRDAWDVPLLGCVPDRPFLGCPCIADLERAVPGGARMVSGAPEHRWRHYSPDQMVVVTTSLTRFLENLTNDKPSRTLYICHVTRDDVIVGFLGEHRRRRKQMDREAREAREGGGRSRAGAEKTEPLEAALLVCGRKGKYSLSPEVEEMIAEACQDDAPVLLAETTTAEALDAINSYTPKLNADDDHRVRTAVDHYEKYIDFDELLRRTSSSSS